MPDDRTRSARRAQRALRDLRRASARPWPRRFAVVVWSMVLRIPYAIAELLRAIAEFILEILGELIPSIIALLLFALISAAAAWGWQQSPAAAVVFVVGMVAFVAFGARELWSRPEGPRRSRVAAIAASTCFFVLIWAAYLVLYLPNFL